MYLWNYPVGWPTFIEEPEREEPIKALGGHPALDVLGTLFWGDIVNSDEKYVTKIQ